MLAYTGEAAGCPGADEAIKGLRQAVGDREFALALAHVHLAADHPDDARVAYLQALSADAASAGARDGLAALDKEEPADTFAAARALLDAGLRDEAKEALAKALQDGATLQTGSGGPSGTASNDELRGLGEHPGLVKRVRAQAGRFVDDVVVVLLGITIALALAWGSLNWTFFDRVRRGSKRRDAPGKGVRRRWNSLTQPKLRISHGSGDGAELLARHVQSVVVGADAANGSDSVRLAAYPEAELDLSWLGDLDARLKPVTALAIWLRHRDTVTATFSIGEEDKRFKRAVLEISARKTPPRLWTIRQASDGVAAPTAAVAGSAAGWLLLTAESMRPRLRMGGSSEDVYGTKSAAGFSAYLGGVEAFRAGDLSMARALFLDSVSEDAANLRAQHNLALTNLLDHNPDVRAVGLRQLEWLLQ